MEKLVYNQHALKLKVHKTNLYCLYYFPKRKFPRKTVTLFQLFSFILPLWKITNSMG